MGGEHSFSAFVPARTVREEGIAMTVMIPTQARRGISVNRWRKALCDHVEYQLSYRVSTYIPRCSSCVYQILRNSSVYFNRLGANGIAEGWLFRHDDSAGRVLFAADAAVMVSSFQNPAYDNGSPETLRCPIEYIVDDEEELQIITTEYVCEFWELG